MADSTYLVGGVGGYLRFLASSEGYIVKEEVESAIQSRGGLRRYYRANRFYLCSAFGEKLVEPTCNPLSLSAHLGPFS
jgi:hypothetical protein